MSTIKVRVLEKDVPVSLSQIQVNMFVRQELDYKHVEFLKGLIDADEPLANMQCVRNDAGELILFDGRHRKEAWYAAGYERRIKIDIVSVGNGSETDFIAAAYAANAGGSKPPTPADTEHTIELLLEREEKMEKIAETLGLPQGMVRKYVNEVKSRLTRAKLQRAASSVTAGNMSVQQAADNHKVNFTALKKLLSARVSKKKEGIDEMVRTITHGYKSVLMRNQKFIRNLLDAFDDGDVDEKRINRVFAHIAEQQKTGARNLEEWKKRFETKTKEVRNKESASESVSQSRSARA